MSLKAFHIVFIVASSALAFGFGAWALHEYRIGGEKSLEILGIGSLVVGAALIVYGKYFLKKLKHISYL